MIIQNVFGISQIITKNPILKESLDIRQSYLANIKKYIQMGSWGNKNNDYIKKQMEIYSDLLLETKYPECHNPYYMQPLPVKYGLILFYDLMAIIGFNINSINQDIIKNIKSNMVDDFHLNKTGEEIFNTITKSVSDKNLISKVKQYPIMKDFDSFLSYIECNINFIEKRLYKILVTATMSAGKSTFINALIGKVTCMAQNMACTSKIHSIIGKAYNDGYTYKNDGYLSLNADKEDLLNNNKDNLSDDISIGTYFDGLLNGQRLVIKDSPGVNFSENLEHKKLSEKMIMDGDYDLLVYIINASQLGTNDEEKHLAFIKKYARETPILFVVNKVDVFNEDEEDIYGIMERQSRYLESNGFKNPALCPLSAKAGLLAKMALSGKINRSNQRELYCLEDKFDKMDIERFYNIYFPEVVILDEDNEEKQLLKTCGLSYIEGIIRNYIKYSVVSANVINKGNLETEFQKAAELFKNCELETAHPLLVKLSEQGYTQANALLYWLLSDGYKGFPADNKVAENYAEKGYHAGDLIASMQYALFVSETSEEREFLSNKYKTRLKEAAEAGDVFSSYMMGIYYLNIARHILENEETEEKNNYLEAISWFKHAANQNFYRAFHSVALRYYWGEGVKKNLESALSWEMKAMEFSKYIKAYYTAADILYDMGNYKNAFGLYIECIEKGGNCYYDIGKMYEYGNGVEQNLESALEYYKKGANLNNNICYLKLGEMYEYGYGVNQDYQTAFEYYEKGANLNNDVCCLALGEMYEYGCGVNQDYQSAFQYYEKGADLCNASCHLHLGRMYIKGNGVEKDAEEALFNFDIGGILGNADCYLYMGLMYEYGDGVKQNLEKAFKYYEEGADLESGACYARMGLFYEEGKGVSKNIEKAVHCYQKAAQYEDSEGEYCLGKCYLFANGITYNTDEARYWLKKAAEQGEERATHLLEKYSGIFGI